MVGASSAVLGRCAGPPQGLIRSHSMSPLRSFMATEHTSSPSGCVHSCLAPKQPHFLGNRTRESHLLLTRVIPGTSDQNCSLPRGTEHRFPTSWETQVFSGPWEGERLDSIQGQPGSHFHGSWMNGEVSTSNTKNEGIFPSLTLAPLTQLLLSPAMV